MIFIDKSIKTEEGRNVNIMFLKDHFDSALLKFTIPLDKSAYNIYATNHKYKDIWRKLLCEEQDFICCYCMRRLTIDNFSAEHIIPQSLKGDDDRPEFLRYVTGGNTAPNIVNGVEYSDETESRSYVSIADIESLTKMPHVISHHNLLAACKGPRGTEITGCCCNHRRGRNYIVPLMLIPGGEKRFEYDPNGIMSISPHEESWKSILSVLNGTTFQTIRRIWYLIANNTHLKSGQFSYATPEIQRINIFKAAFKQKNFLNIPKIYRSFIGRIMGKGNDYTWKLLVDYSWFLEYYRNH